MTLKRVYHVAVHTRDLEASKKFYETIGFEMVRGSEVDNPALEEAFGVNGHRLRWAHAQMGATEDVALLDLVQWVDPAPEGEPIQKQNHVGLARFSILSDDLEADYEALVARGIPFMLKPATVQTPLGPYKMCFALDPDGTPVQLVQPPYGHNE